jgi:hypothetical protein
MSDAFTNLLAALLGAIVGGLLTLAGSVLVNRWELRRTARFRIYEELLPKITQETWPSLKLHGEQPELFHQSMDALQRASTILGPNEWRAASIAQLDAMKYLERFFSKPESEDEKQERARELEAIAKEIDDNLVELDTTVKLQFHPKLIPGVARGRSRAWRRSAAATLTGPARVSMPMTRLRKAAMTLGPAAGPPGHRQGPRAARLQVADRDRGRDPSTSGRAKCASHTRRAGSHS